VQEQIIFDTTTKDRQTVDRRNVSPSAIIVTKTKTKTIVCYNTRIKTKMKGTGKYENEIEKVTNR